MKASGCILQIVVALSVFCSASAGCQKHSGRIVDIKFANAGGSKLNIALRTEDIRTKNANYVTHVVPHFATYKNDFGRVVWDKDVPAITLEPQGEALLHLPRCTYTEWFTEGSKGEGSGHTAREAATVEIFSDESPPRGKFKKS